VSDRSQTTKSQEADLEAYASKCDEEVTWYKDVATGTNMARPGMEAMMDGVRAGKINRIICWRLDRLGRTSIGLHHMFAELTLHNCSLVSLRDGFDLHTPAGRMMAGVLASVAVYETEVRKERQMAGIQRALADGKRWGGRKKGTRIKVTVEKEAEICRMFRAGVAKARISRVVEITEPTIYAVLRRNGLIPPSKKDQAAAALENDATI